VGAGIFAIFDQKNLKESGLENCEIHKLPAPSPVESENRDINKS